MKIDTEQVGAALPPVRAGAGRPGAEADFADMLTADRLRAEAAAARDAALAAQPAAKHDANAEDIADIRENGLRAYAEELHRKHLEDLRAKILEKMGLSEDDLEAMPADRRNLIEDIIAHEIEARQAAESLTDGDGDVAGTANGPRPNGDAPALLAAEAGGITGAVAGAAVMAAMDAAEDAAKGEAEPDAG